MKDNLILGKFTPAPSVPNEELKAAYSRIVELEAALHECRDYFEVVARDPDHLEMEILVRLDEVLL